jgi:hypothetical protein
LSGAFIGVDRVVVLGVGGECEKVTLRDVVCGDDDDDDEAEMMDGVAIPPDCLCVSMVIVAPEDRLRVCCCAILEVDL